MIAVENSKMRNENSITPIWFMHQIKLFYERPLQRRMESKPYRVVALNEDYVEINESRNKLIIFSHFKMKKSKLY